MKIFDITLRDGEQSPGCSMTLDEKLRIAKALAELGVDIVEAGFPAASKGDWEAVAAVAAEVKGPTICALAHCTRDDIDKSWSALAKAARPRLKRGQGAFGDTGGQKKNLPSQLPKQSSCVRFIRISIAPASWQSNRRVQVLHRLGTALSTGSASAGGARHRG